MNATRLTKLFLRLFIISICATAITGVIAISVPSGSSWFGLQIFFTTATIAGASVCGLACGGCLTRGHRVLPLAGLFFTRLLAPTWLAAIWIDNYLPDIYVYIAWSLLVYAIACAHLSLLFMANLAGAYRWAYVVAYQLILGLATLLAALVWFRDLGATEVYWRLTGAISILVAAITLLIPVFQYLSRNQIEVAHAVSDPLFAVEEEIARLKKRLIDLEGKRHSLLGRTGTEAEDAAVS